MIEQRGATERLSGIRVLEIGEMVSAPYAAKLLADLGADVIKVEPPEGDRARRRGPFPPVPKARVGVDLFGDGDGGSAGRHGNGAANPDLIPDPNTSGLYLALNTNKRSIVIDQNIDGLKRLADLVSEADIIITNLSPERLRAIGFDAAEAMERRPGLVICSITAFGLQGPYSGYQAEEITVAHGGGWAYQCPGASTETEKPPLKVYGHQTDFQAAMAAAMVCLASFDRAERTGVGDHIDFSSMAHSAGMLEAALISASYLGVSPNRLGSRLLNPWRMFECAPQQQIFEDGNPDPTDLVFLVTVEQDQWERLVEFMGNPEWVATGLFDTMEQRLENEDLLVLYIEEWTKKRTVEQLWHEGQDNRICFAPVLTMADMESQQHLNERGFFVDVQHPVAGAVKHLGQPFHSHPRLWGPLEAAPVLDPEATPAFGPSRPHVGLKPELEPQLPLAGVRVLDLSWVWAGPYCGLHLSFLGAEVIKIESAMRPGLGRRLPLHPPDVIPTLNTSAYFNQWDQGKLSCQLDLANPEAIEIIKGMVAESDVVIENFATGVMEKLGIGYGDLSAINPGIVMASVSGYGSSGPLKDYMGYGPTTGPLSGLSSLTGYRDGPPRELGIAVGDPSAGITAAFAITAALVTRRVSGQGCYIDVSLWESTASNAVEGWMCYSMTGTQPERQGNRDSVMAPHGCYRTGDLYEDPDQADDLGPDPGLWITIACADDDQWRKLAALMDPPLTDDPRFATMAARKQNEDALDKALQVWVLGNDRWDLTKTLQTHGIAAFPSLSTADLLADEHLAARNFFVMLNHHEVGTRVHTGLPWLSATSPDGLTRPAPLIGQHTAQVLADVLDLSDEQIAELHSRGVTR